MLKTVAELKELILWAKAEGIKSLKVGDIEMQVSDYEFAKQIMEQEAVQVAPSKSEAKNTEKTMIDTLNEASDEELLYLSSGN